MLSEMRGSFIYFFSNRMIYFIQLTVRHWIKNEFNNVQYICFWIIFKTKAITKVSRILSFHIEDNVRNISLDMTGSELTFFSMLINGNHLIFRAGVLVTFELDRASQTAIISRFTRCLLRDRVCIWMRSQWTHPSRRDEGAGFEASQWLRTYREISPRILRRRESCESNECHKVARRRTATAVKLCETTRCCRIVGANARGFRGLIFSFNRVLR